MNPSENEAKNENAKRLREALNAKRLQRSSATNQRTFLEKNKVPSEMIETCMNHLQRNTPHAKQVLQAALQTTKLAESIPMPTIVDNRAGPRTDPNSTMNQLD